MSDYKTQLFEQDTPFQEKLYGCLTVNSKRKRYHCELCDKSFARRDRLTQHQQTKHFN